MAVDKNKILDDVLNKINKEFPDERVNVYSKLNNINVECISTGSIAVDKILNGGFPKGRISEVVGKASSGKTTICLSSIAALQREKPDANIVYIDAENALDPDYARSIGVDFDKLILMQPDSGDTAYQAAFELASSGVIDMLVIDSIPAMIPKASFDYKPGEQQKIALGATLDNQGVSRLVSAAKKTKCVIILINQYRERVQPGMIHTQGDGVSGNGYLPGGQSLPFMMSVILKIQRHGKVFKGDEVVADSVTAAAIKNKIGRPYGTAEFAIDYDKGVSLPEDIINLGPDAGVVGNTARSYWLIDADATKKAKEQDPNAKDIVIEGSRQGSREKFKEWLYANPDYMYKAKHQILKNLDSERFFDREKFKKFESEADKMNNA